MLKKSKKKSKFIKRTYGSTKKKAYKRKIKYRRKRMLKASRMTKSIQNRPEKKYFLAEIATGPWYLKIPVVVNPNMIFM